MKALLLAPMGSVHRRFNTANIDALKSLGYEVHLAANFEVGDGTEKQNSEYVEQCRKKRIITHSIAYERHSLRCCINKRAETRKLLQEECFDIVHAHTETGGFILRIAGKPYKKSKYVYTPHGMSFYKGSSIKSQLVYRPLEHWICSMMDSNIAINQEEYAVLQRWTPQTAVFVHGIGLDLERFQQVDNGCRNTIRQELKIPKFAKVVMSTGELDDNKNHQVIIRAISSMKRDDVYYIICGVGPNKEKLEKIASECGLGNRVKLLGYRRDIPEILCASDIFAFPSFHEGLPVSLMEAMAAGLPVVCSRIRGNVDLVQEGKSGFTANPSEAEAFAGEIEKVLNNDADLNSMGNWNKAYVESYSYQNVLRELENKYRRLR